ncbi:MAG: hypothetical protein HY289_08070 [Planctomycetes bacterium]|nr:hypothetical protein [Planctomycetota bacterium]
MARSKKRYQIEPQSPRPLLYIAQILEWADAHHRRTGRWPTHESGRIPGTFDEKWRAIDENLRRGQRGLRPGSSISRLLAAYRGHRNRKALPRLKIRIILLWVDAYHHRTGQWPNKRSGPIPEAPGETWSGVNTALIAGIRHLPGGSSLPRLLSERRGVRNIQDLPHMSVAQILIWADAHHQRTGRWPKINSGPIREAPGETWSAVDSALWACKRWIRKRTSLARLLTMHRGVRNEKNLPDLTIRQILEWADAHHRRTGAWPKRTAGRIVDAPGENWHAVGANLHHGGRGLPAGSSLPRLLQEHRGVRNHKALPRLTCARILRWARAHRRRTGHWPTRQSGPIPDAPQETWGAINSALQIGGRGLPAGSSLARLFAQ